MVVIVYISGISGNKEVKKRQQRVLMILDSKNIKYDVIDITEPGKEADKEFMQNNATSNGGTVSDPNPRSPLPPQLFNDDEYCGDYDHFDMANEVDTLEQFLKLEVPPEPIAVENDKENTLNGDVTKDSKENSQEKEIPETPETENEKSSAKEEPASREATPAKVEEEAEKEKSPEKEPSPERQQSVEKEKTPEAEAKPQVAEEIEGKHISKENTPEVESVNENGTVSSRDQSQEKETESKKDPSELLIESEKSAE